MFLGDQVVVASEQVSNVDMSNVEVSIVDVAKDGLPIAGLSNGDIPVLDVLEAGPSNGSKTRPEDQVGAVSSKTEDKF